MAATFKHLPFSHETRDPESRYCERFPDDTCEIDETNPENWIEGNGARDEI